MISIAMATYNGEKYLAEQLDSILNQTYSDFELIICDDCSTDGTRKILSDYEARDGRIKVILNERNLGFKKNFERAVSFCGGEYIAFSDQDDFWNPDKLELSLSRLGEHDLVCTNAELTDADLNSLGCTAKSDKFNSGIFREPEELLKCLVHRNFVQGATILAKGELIKRYLPIPDDCLFHDQYYAVCAAMNGGIEYMETPSMKYRQHECNAIGAKTESLREFLLPAKLDLDKLKKDSLNSLSLIKLIRQSSYGDSLKDYLDDSEKYFLAFPDKNFSMLGYVNKYFEYIYDYSFFKKRMMMAKRFAGIVRFKLFARRK